MLRLPYCQCNPLEGVPRTLSPNAGARWSSHAQRMPIPRLPCCRCDPPEGYPETYFLTPGLAGPCAPGGPLCCVWPTASAILLKGFPEP